MKASDKKLFEEIDKKLKFNFVRFFLVKPLPDEKIKKEITVPVMTGKKDENGYAISDSETKVQEVLTTYKKGIVLRVPMDYIWQSEHHPEVGNIIAYNRKAGHHFDLFKNSELVNPYDVVAFYKEED